MPAGSSTTARNTARLHLTVTDLPAVRRVLTLLTGRTYVLTGFEADDAGDGCWRVALDVVADPARSSSSKPACTAGPACPESAVPDRSSLIGALLRSAGP